MPWRGGGGAPGVRDAAGESPSVGGNAVAGAVGARGRGAAPSRAGHARGRTAQPPPFEDRTVSLCRCVAGGESAASAAAAAGRRTGGGPRPGSRVGIDGRALLLVDRAAGLQLVGGQL